MMQYIVLVTLFGVALATDVVPEPRSGCNFAHTFTALGQRAHLNSPNWPSNYPPNSNCLYQLASPAGTQIELDCTEINIEYNSGCTYDRMTVSLSGESTLRDGLIICGQGTFKRTTQANQLALGFTSDSANPQSNSLFRFQCTVTVVQDPNSAAVAPPPAQESAVPGFSDPTCSCGTRNEGTRIVGGVNAITNEFPWRVALYSESLGVFCGGTIISPNWVLTAAHCTRALKGQPMYIDAGDHDIATTTDANNEVIKCAQIIEHANYNNQTQDNDIALCRLETPLTFSRTIQPGCLPWSLTGHNFQGKTVTASGWGTTSSGGRPSTVLKKVDLPVKTTEECRAYYGNSITNNMFCTYSAGKDTCQGDSGGSIDYREPNTGRYFAVGVVSWGVGCAGVNQPGVYVKMTNYLNWIQSNTAGETFCR